MKRGKTAFLKLAVSAMGVAALVLAVFWMPKMAGNIIDLNPEYAHLRYPALAGIYATMIPFFIAIYQALKLLGAIEKKNVFSKSAAESLKVIKYCAAAIAGLYVLGILFLGIQSALNASSAVVAITLMFSAMTIALFAAVLEELLMKAIEIKSENDLTI